MKQFFPEILISALALVFAAMAIFLFLRHDTGDAFKWASGISGQLIASLLTLVVKQQGSGEKS